MRWRKCRRVYGRRQTQRIYGLHQERWGFRTGVVTRGLRRSGYTKGELERTSGVGKRRVEKVDPDILIFDVDGVLIDVKETFWRSALQTVKKLTGKKATWAELHKWKRQPGNNDDWMMVSQWATASGVPTTYEEARAAFQPFYWGSNGKPGNVAKEKWLVTPKLVEKSAKRRWLRLFSGRKPPGFSGSFSRLAPGQKFPQEVTHADTRWKTQPPWHLAQFR